MWKTISLILCLILIMIAPSIALKRAMTCTMLQRSSSLRSIFNHPSSTLSKSFQYRPMPHHITSMQLSTKPVDEDSSVKGNIKEIWKNYGTVAIATYFSIYALTLGSVFTSLEFDVFSASTFGFDPVTAVKKVCDLVETVTGSKALPEYIRQHPTVGTFALAWVMTKFTEPARLAFTVYIVPKIARYIGRAPPLIKKL